MSKGRVDVRYTQRTGKARLRFYGVAEDHLENILSALEIARLDLGTEFDTVALDAICMNFHQTYAPTIRK